MTSLRAWFVAAAVCVHAALATAQPAQPDSDENGDATEVARRHFESGVEYYRDGDLEAALVAFKRAMAARPNYKLLYNLGQLSQELHDYPAAERYLRDYLVQGADEIDPSRRAQVEDDLDKLAGRIATLTITSNLEGTQFLVDEVAIGRSPLPAPVKVSAGRRRIVATHAGRADVTRVIDVAGRESLIVHLEFPERGAPVTATPATTARDDAEGGGLHPAVWVGAASGAVLVGGGVMALLAARDQDAYDRELTKPTTQQRLDELADRTRDKALVTDVLLGIGVAGAITTLVFALAHDPSPSTARDAALRVGPGGVSFQTRF